MEHLFATSLRGVSSREATRGAALVIALILLVILALLGTTGMNTAVAELVMAGNEQFHQNASDAAAAGIEAAVARLSATVPLSGSVIADAATGATGTSATSQYAATIRYAGEESNIPRSSAGKFAGLHIEIESTGRSARNAIDVQTQGVLLVSPVNGVSTFVRRGTGLQGGSRP